MVVKLTNQRSGAADEKTCDQSCRVIERHIRAMRAIGRRHACGIHDDEVCRLQPFEHARLLQLRQQSLINVAAAIGFLPGQTVGNRLVIRLVGKRFLFFERVARGAFRLRGNLIIRPRALPIRRTSSWIDFSIPSS